MDAQLKVELVKLYQFSVDGKPICNYPAQENWHQIRERVIRELQQQFGMPESAARGAWERIQASDNA